MLYGHGDIIDFPASAQRLAFNAQYENQAFSYGGHVLALQFHLEADDLILPALAEFHVTADELRLLIDKVLQHFVYFPAGRPVL